MRFVAHPYTLIAALAVLGIVLGVSCWPRVQQASVTPTPTPAPPSPTVYVFYPSVTPTPPDVFTVPPTAVPERLPTAPQSPPMAPTATHTPTVAPSATPTETPEGTRVPAPSMVQRG